jgi:HD-GYP domain-containing protein (c-di-GMP phosphodiesterase class II)
MDHSTLPECRSAAVSEPAQTNPSVLGLLNCCSAQLERLLSELRSLSDAEPALRAIAAHVVQALALDADIALASIFLNRISGTYPVRHCVEAALVAVLLARAMHQTDEQMLVIACAALTMNVAMLAQHDSFQNQRAALTPAEVDAVHRHPNAGAELLQGAGVRDQAWISSVMQHHEHDDGSGYPDGRTGADIAPGARLIGLADRYCAMVSARNYRRSMRPDLALGMLLSPGAGFGVDAELARHFIAELGPYPPGTLVRLCNGEVGVVTRREGPNHGLCVHALQGADDGPAAEVAGTKVRDTAQAHIFEALHEDQVPIRFSMQQVWGELASL